MSPTPSNRYAAAVSTWLLVEGVWGFFSPVVMGFLSTNRLQATIHVALGIFGLWKTFSDRSVGFLWLLGGLLVAVGLLYFVPGGRALSDVLAVNEAGAVLNLFIGLVALILAVLAGRGTR